MRYVVAMLFAVVGAVLAFLFVSNDFATWLVKTHMTFDNPDQNDNWHDLVFMATNLVGLVIGWVVGWVVSAALPSEE